MFTKISPIDEKDPIEDNPLLTQVLVLTGKIYYDTNSVARGFFGRNGMVFTACLTVVAPAA